MESVFTSSRQKKVGNVALGYSDNPRKNIILNGHLNT